MASVKNTKHKTILWIIIGVVICGLIAVSIIVLWKQGRDESPNLTDQNLTTGSVPTIADTPLKPSVPPVTIPQDQLNPADPDMKGLRFERLAKLSGRFVEDGSDSPCEDVAVLLVRNTSDQFLDLANIVYEIDGKEAFFMVTGLPAGSAAWVLEYSGMKLTDASKIAYKGISTSFKEGVVNETNKITIEADGYNLRATNNTDKTLENVFIYYKSVHTDGYYFGGITYRVEFGTLKPGETLEKVGGHYSEDKSEIVRIGWLEATE